MTHQTTANDNFDPPTGICPPVSERPALCDVLTPDEVDLMARYIANAHTQTQIAEENGDVGRTAIGYRVRKAAKKLIDAGFPVKLPGKGRRPLMRVAPIDPGSINCLKSGSGEDGAGRARMKWTKARKIDSDGADRQW